MCGERCVYVCVCVCNTCAYWRECAARLRNGARVMHCISVPDCNAARNGQNIVRFRFDLRITSYDDTMRLPIHGTDCGSNELVSIAKIIRQTVDRIAIIANSMLRFHKIKCPTKVQNVISLVCGRQNRNRLKHPANTHTLTRASLI